MPRRARSPEVIRTRDEVLSRRGYQRFYYHTHDCPIAHWWDTADLLNNVQMDIEDALDGIPVELIHVREFLHNKIPMMQAFFKIGPIPDPTVPIREKTFLARENIAVTEES